jgi:hypothetical protein
MVLSFRFMRSRTESLLTLPKNECAAALFSPRQSRLHAEENLLLSQSTEGHLGNTIEQARAHILGPTQTMVDIAKKRSSHLTDANLSKYENCLSV